jgi:hypothetical protein
MPLRATLREWMRRDPRLHHGGEAIIREPTEGGLDSRSGLKAAVEQITLRSHRRRRRFHVDRTTSDAVQGRHALEGQANPAQPHRATRRCPRDPERHRECHPIRKGEDERHPPRRMAPRFQLSANRIEQTVGHEHDLLGFT